jgi:hypothetical protein
VTPYQSYLLIKGTDPLENISSKQRVGFQTCPGGIPVGMCICLFSGLYLLLNRSGQVYGQSSASFSISRNSEAGALRNTCRCEGSTPALLQRKRPQKKLIKASKSNLFITIQVLAFGAFRCTYSISYTIPCFRAQPTLVSRI